MDFSQTIFFFSCPAMRVALLETMAIPPLLLDHAPVGEWPVPECCSRARYEWATIQTERGRASEKLLSDFGTAPVHPRPHPGSLQSET